MTTRLQGEVEIELREYERVVSRGTHRETWRVQVEDEALSACAWPGARMESLDRQRGVVWERSITLSLPVGSIVELVIRTPMTQQRASALDHLMGRTSREVEHQRCRQFRVTASGKLVAVAPQTRR